MKDLQHQLLFASMAEKVVVFSWSLCQLDLFFSLLVYLAHVIHVVPGNDLLWLLIGGCIG